MTNNNSTVDEEMTRIKNGRHAGVIQEYASVDNSNNDDDDERGGSGGLFRIDDNDDDELAGIVESEDNDHALPASQQPNQNQRPAQNKRPRTRRLIVPSSPPGNSALFCKIWLCFALVLLIIAIILLSIKNNEMAEQFENEIAKLWSHVTSSGTDSTDSDGSSSTTPSSSSTSYSTRTIHYDSIHVASLNWNPYDIIGTTAEEATRLVIPTPYYQNDNLDDNDNGESLDTYGYIHDPDIVDDYIAFTSEGELYYTRILKSKDSNASSPFKTMPAIKLATTVGNIRWPKINPVYPYLIAYRGTYEAQSEVYLLDLRQRKQKFTQRLTYFETGVTNIIGWKDDGLSIIFAAQSNAAASFPDERLYEITLLTENNDTNSTAGATSTIDNVSLLSSNVAFDVRPVPLAQANDGVYKTWNSNNDDPNVIPNDECIYFVRYRQYSKTVRYIGGTAESIWAYCDGENVTVHVTNDYIGTSKHPRIITYNSISYLLFLSDRSYNNNDTDSRTWIPTTMNLWATTLPTREELYSSGTATTSTKASLKYKVDTSNFIQLTHISCQFNGMALQEYAADSSTGQIILRVGADLYYSTIGELVGQATTKPIRLPIHVLSDLREQQERLIDVENKKHLLFGDFFETSYGTMNMILTIRGQVWVVPVIDDYKSYSANKYGGSGQNLPPDRRYRVIPGAMTGGSIRVLKAMHVPLLASAANHDDIFHLHDNDNNKTRDMGSTTATGDQKFNTTTATPKDTGRRLALVLATDPDSPTAEHAFYMVEVQADSINSFTNLQRLPKPFIGGSVSGGPTSKGGLGTIDPSTLTVSPCGRRFAWTDTDNRICVMTMPIYIDPSYMNATKSASTLVNGDTNGTTPTSTQFKYYCLPPTNNMGEPLAGTLADLRWSPGGRYLAVEHNAKNQFAVVTVVDCGDPESSNSTLGGLTTTVADIQLGAAVQVTPSRFNSYGVYWGITTFDSFLQQTLELDDSQVPSSTTLYFLSDRDIVSDVNSPWGSRQPSPHFPKLLSNLYALPLNAKSNSSSTGTYNIDQDIDLALLGRFAGGGAMEVFADTVTQFKDKVTPPSSDNTGSRRQRNLSKISSKLADANRKRRLSPIEKSMLVRYLSATASDTEDTVKSPFPKDIDIDFGNVDDSLSLARRAYRITQVPKAKYLRVLAQTTSDASLSLIAIDDDDPDKKNFLYFSFDTFPSDKVSPQNVEDIVKYELSTDRKYFYLTSQGGKIRAIENTASGITGMIGDDDWSSSRGNIEDMVLSVWPALEYQQMYNDAWRLLRDYFYDVNMHGVDWDAVHARYKGLVRRCAKREELDDVLSQMIAELSVLHAFVYGGEYNAPDAPSAQPAFLGAQLQRVPEWKGYMVTDISEPDPDFNLVDGSAIYSPLSDQNLRLTGQRGLHAGDVIVGINGESVLQGTNINMHLRGSAQRSVRLEVLRLKSGRNVTSSPSMAIPEPLIVVPITDDAFGTLQYNSIEWKKRQKAKELAAAAGFTVGYIHMQAMDKEGEDAFARGFFPDYDKDALIIDVRHNEGGNTDSWIENYLQRRIWSYFRGRNTHSERNGDIDWDQQFAFRGKVVVLVDEYTASNGEGVSRGISELGLGKTVGTQTWGGGIWGSSSNRLVDGGIATAPQWGTWNDKFGWGSGIEATGLTPDVIVDNDPYQTFYGTDTQLEQAIIELKAMLAKDPAMDLQIPDQRPDMSLKGEVCPTE